MCRCYKIDQTINHHDIKVSRQEARKEIDFGLETYEELNSLMQMSYKELFRKESAFEDRWRKLQLQWADYE
jgi:hypothetical protein